MDILKITNDGPDITSTNYWGSAYDWAGKYFCSCHADAVRILIPHSSTHVIDEWGLAEYVILSRGPWPERKVGEAVELLFEDHTNNPYVLFLTSESFDVLPAEPEPGTSWTFSAWIWREHAPRKVFERPIRWRQVRQIPDLSAWNDHSWEAGE